MIKLWMAPGGLHIEPGQTRDAGELARIHALGFYRGWPTAEFASFLSEADREWLQVETDLELQGWLAETARKLGWKR